MTTDTNIIEVTGDGLTTTVPDVSVTTNTSTTTVAGNVVTPQINTPNVNEELIKVVVTGLGEENIPDPRLFKFLSDKFGFSEQKLFDVFKNLADLTTTQEQVQKLLQKVLLDITSNSDVFDRVWTAFRTHADSTTNTEQLEKDFAKVLADVSNSSDLLSTDVGKYLANITALANLSYAVMLVGKTLQDQTIEFSDVLSRIVDFNRTFEDTVFTTDDFFGDANIDDDQTAQVFKVLLEWISLPETFSVDIDKPDLTDQATLAEQAYLATEIPRTDQVIKSDLQTSAIALVKLDETTNSEQQAFDVIKPDRIDQTTTSDQQAFDVIKPDRLDQFTNSEQVNKLVEQTSQDSFNSQSEEYYFDIDKPDLTDTALVPEQVALDVSIPADSDQVSIAELLLTKLIGLNINEIDYFLEDYIFDITDYTFKAVHPRDQITQIVVAKLVEELVDATDDFYGETNVDDDQIAIVDKVVNDYPTFSEAFDRLVFYIRLFTETATLLEQAELSTTKVVEDQTTKSEETSFDTNKVSNDQITAVETQLFDIEQISTDQFNSSEQAYLSVTIPQTDGVVNTDEFATFYEAVRQFTEQTQTTELFEQLVEKVSEDQALFTDLVTQTIEKLTLDQATTSEEQTFDFTAVYSDLVDATDDFYGEANIDDDQIATVDKVLADYAINSEEITTVAEFYRTFLEIAYNTDLATFDFAKSIVEIVVTTSEIVAIDFETTREDISSISETVQQDFDTARTENITQADLFTQSIEPAKYEIITTSESTNYDVSLEKLEDANTSEVVNADFITSRTEIAAIIETFISEFEAYRDFIETVTQTDLVNISTDKPVDESISTSEDKFFDTIKRPLDTATVSEVIGKDSTTEFSDIVDATDDFYGAATVGDDEFATFDKVLAEYASNSEVLEILTDFLRSVNENQILSEVFAAATDKALSDITNSSDTVILLPAPSKLESVATSQTISLTLQSYFSQDYVELGYTGETYTY